MFNTPILLITFNRPNHTRRVFEEIKKQKPTQLFVFQDGAREGNETDIEKCAAVRAIFTEPLDWDCELKTYFSEKNLGCGPGPATGITWFFDNVEQGIIFEDDCLPSETLFRFYEDLLNHYKKNNKIGLITGSNLKIKWDCKNKSYLFARVGGPTLGCWASWKRVWDLYDFNMSSWKEEKNKSVISRNFANKSCYNSFAPFFDKYCDNKQVNDAWDYQWFYCLVLNNFVSVVSSVNQVSNIGFDADATHDSDSNHRMANLPLNNITLPLKYRQKIKIDRLYDWLMYNRYYRRGKKSLFRKIILKIIEIYYTKIKV